MIASLWNLVNSDSRAASPSARRQTAASLRCETASRSCSATVARIPTPGSLALHLKTRLRNGGFARGTRKPPP